jgi:hypothetical protein
MTEIEKHIRIVKSNFNVIPCDKATIVIVLAISCNNDLNKITEISCKEGLAITKMAFNIIDDSYLVRCRSHLNLGKIPIGFVVEMKDNIHWQFDVPVPEVIMKKLFSEQQKKMLNKWKNLYKDCIFRYLQLRDI